MTSAILSSFLIPARAERGNPHIQFEGRSVDDMVAEFLEENQVPGMSLAIVQAPYITRVSNYGLADPTRRTLVAANTVFDVGQMKNAFTAVAIMQLVEAGKLGLDDALAKFLSAEKRTVGEALRDPGAYPTLEQVVARASGTDYETFVREGQIERLGLQHTFFSKALDAVPQDVFPPGGNHGEFLHAAEMINPIEPAVGHRQKGGFLEPVPRGKQALFSTASDISTWDIGLAGDILIQDAGLRKLLYHAPKSDGVQVPTAGAWIFPGHEGLLYTSSDQNGVSTLLSRFTKSDELVCVTLCANKGGLDLTQLARKIAGAYNKKLGPPARTAAFRVQQSPYSVHETINRLEKVLVGRGVGIVARVDHQKSAQSKELDLRPTEELIFGSPAMGTPLMQDNPAISADLPLRASAWEENGEVLLVATDPVELSARHGISDQRDRVYQMRQGVDSALLKAVAPGDL